MYSWADMIQMVKLWIDEDLENIPLLSELAGRLGYSVFYVSKKFHEIEGISLREYTANRRVCQAADKLYTTTEKIIDIAVRYEYSSQEAFSRAFSKVYGITPAAYRRMQKPTPTAKKAALLGLFTLTEPNKMIGGKDMKLYVRQMQDWNCYAYYAEDVDEQYWDYFKSELYWQIGNSFIRQYDNVADFEYCAKNFTQYGELAIKQQLKLLPCPWEKALDLFVSEINKLGVDWFIHGSVAMALHGIDVEPGDVNIIIPNCSDFDKVRSQFYRLAIKPIERCEDWVMSGGGGIFMEANIGIWFYNEELEPYNMDTLVKIPYRNGEVYVSTLEMLKTDNENYGRRERVALIAERMKQGV